MSKRWTKEETIIAFNLYCKIPFKKAVKSNYDVIHCAQLIGRSPSSVAMKLGNFGSLDPELASKGISGLTNRSKLDEEVWEDFNKNWEDLAFESEKLIAKFKNKNIEQVDLNRQPEGIDRLSKVKTRVNQSFFRDAVLSSYNQTCCITGISIKELLIASHIKPWSEDKKNRTNPHNGLCLNALHDKAFDKGYITITPEYTVLISKFFDVYTTNKAENDYLLSYQNQKILKPDRFLPAREFLDYHYNEIFIQ